MAAIAKFHSERGTKTALIMVKANPLVISMSPCYVTREGVEYYAGKPTSDLEKGDTFEIPDGFKLSTMPELDEEGNTIVDPETGEVKLVTTKTGEPLHVLTY